MSSLVNSLINFKFLKNKKKAQREEVPLKRADLLYQLLFSINWIAIMQNLQKSAAKKAKAAISYRSILKNVKII